MVVTLPGAVVFRCFEVGKPGLDIGLLDTGILDTGGLGIGAVVLLGGFADELGTGGTELPMLLVICDGTVVFVGTTG